MTEQSTHLTLLASPSLMSLVSSQGDTIPNTERRIMTHSFLVMRSHFAESLGNANISVRIEWRDIELARAWETLVPDEPGIGGSASAAIASPEIAIPQVARGDIRIRAVASGTGLLSPLIQYVEIEMR